jgi:hypothetical protein
MVEFNVVVCAGHELKNSEWQMMVPRPRGSLQISKSAPARAGLTTPGFTGSGAPSLPDQTYYSA